MAYDLRYDLLKMLPTITTWAKTMADAVAAAGVPLDDENLARARRAGVLSPDRIRVQLVDRMPRPSDPVLRRVAMATGLLGPDSRAITLGHSIQIRHGEDLPSVYAHEFRHVHQYETAGSIGAFLALYLAQIVAYGYRDAPLEIDARTFEAEA